MLYNKDDATKGKFAFTTEEYDMFEICFESRIPHGEYSVGYSIVCRVCDFLFTHQQLLDCRAR